MTELEIQLLDNVKKLTILYEEIKSDSRKCIDKLLKENFELKQAVTRLSTQNKSLIPLICSNADCNKRKCVKVCKCGRIIDNE